MLTALPATSDAQRITVGTGSDDWYFQSLIAASSDTDFHDSVAAFDYQQSEEHNFLTAFSVGRKISDNFLLWPFDVIGYVSLQQFNERGTQPGAWGATMYGKVYHNFYLPRTGIQMRLGFGNGLSYVSRIPRSEVRDFQPHAPQKLAYHMEYSLHTSLGVLSKNLQDVYIGYSVWHRSSAFGLLGDATGGVNYLGLSIETSLR